MRVTVIGAGIGGLSAAIRVAHAGHDVVILEARHDVGGLAGAVVIEDQTFDAGPYVLLDRPGLEWAFAQLGVELPPLDRLDDVVYEVTWPDGQSLCIYDDVDRTAREIGASYTAFVDTMRRRYEQLAPMLRVSHPNAFTLIRSCAITAAPFLIRSLASVMRGSGLGPRAVEALTIWTHVAGQSLETAPSPMAFVPALIHTHGAWRPRGGTSAIALALRDAAIAAGVRIEYGVRVRSIDEIRGSDAIISNHHAIGTYVDLVPSTPQKTRRRLQRIPLQSPGACAYLGVKSSARHPYLRFRLGGDLRCRLLVTHGDTARLILPGGDSRTLGQALEERWWQEGFESTKVLLRRTPEDWGRDYTLYRNSMNAVMTGAFMRRGRIAHRSRDVRGLYLAGSSTHPGQWISFCAISGVLAARALLEDARA